MRQNRWTVLIAALALTAACGENRDDEPMTTIAMPTESLSDISEARWLALRSRPIFFGHQSVGGNIMAGVRRVIADNPAIGLHVTTDASPGAVDGGTFFEAEIGENTRPATKTAHFSAVLDEGFGAADNAIAMYKFCYIDMLPTSDPDQLFAEYAAGIEAVRSRYPELEIVHFTLPLRTAATGLKEQVRLALGRQTETRLNMKRNRYNELLRERYAGTDPIFDLALIESTRPDGSRAYSQYFGQKVYMLAPEWTDDGGHLNDDAQSRVAEQLLVFLASLDGGVTDRLSKSDVGSTRP